MNRSQNDTGNAPSARRAPGGCKLVLSVSAADLRQLGKVPLTGLSTSELVSELVLGRFLLLEQSVQSRYLLIENAPCFGFVSSLKSALHQVKEHSQANMPDMYQRFELRLERDGDGVLIRDVYQPKQPGIYVDIRSLSKELHAASQEIFDTLLQLIPELAQRSDLDEIRRAMK